MSKFDKAATKITNTALKLTEGKPDRTDSLIVLHVALTVVLDEFFPDSDTKLQVLDFFTSNVRQDIIEDPFAGPVAGHA